MEKELKLCLPDREDYERLEQRLGEPEHTARQVNVYLDTPERALQQNRIMARIRDEGAPLRMTVKWGASHGDGYFQAQEEEADLKAQTAEDALQTGEAASVLASLCPPARELGLERLGILGRLLNHRKRYSVEDFVLELDHSSYGDGAEDFELELETEHPQEANRLLGRLLSESGARGQPQTLTKFERFLVHCPQT